ncbi:DUF4956 domain-containing protein [Mycolicibacterium diernhoferi]|uniref:DUF4956 domain-containing protein n=1 Tax=Mycolicibacterium diernhoferi TaxID=1801 RepID=A0A1Q4HD81_9MYCO|nr:DUF4956 domain-containing protein [Mycolicibacterium diernhoferi]OJZ65507.1 DUF4956 domain-containing protein [Mycolicibacterium diernhoferi]OPE53483.1 DUF4956 domain-containing protein [Mycolicibacterium diernhoferi]PEG51908.1 DUF4956 domain-containing protein [Mycolicibacterium diernhoferi]QYL22247.1 DUF4956 domain-containing protein [Mycolicibacterium diernhoferi]
MNINLQDLSGTFSTFDVIASLSLSLVLALIIGWVYRYTHKNVSYSQSYVQTLVLVCMVVSVIMLVVGSNIARAFALVGALSVIRFRNAIKETRDVGFVFLVMAIGMTTGTRFYTLAVAATIAICLVLVIMSKFNLFKLDVKRQVVKVQVPPDPEFTDRVEDTLIEYCSEFELVSTESVRSGALNELYYTAQLKKNKKSSELIAALSAVNTGQRVTVLTGYDQTDI